MSKRELFPQQEKELISCTHPILGALADIAFSSPLDGRLYLHGGIDQEGAVACVEGLFVFDPGRLGYVSVLYRHDCNIYL